MKIRTTVQIVLAVAIVVLAYFIYQSIMAPLRFEKEKALREDVVVQRLKDIRAAETAYKARYGRYTASFDTLIMFLENGKMPFVVKIGNVPDTLTEAEALKMGIISRDTVLEEAYKVVFPEHADKEKHLERLRYVPFTDRTETIQMEAAVLEKNNLKVPVIRVRVSYDTYLRGVNDMLMNNLVKAAEDLDKYPGLQFGSMDEPVIDGNWE